MRTLGGLAALLLSATASPQALSPEQVPEPLKPWVGWALKGHESKKCPFLQGGADAPCTWPARLLLDIGPKGGTFSQSWRVHLEAWVPVPGETAAWPQEVRVDGAAALVRDVGGVPEVFLRPGDHVVSGRFTWDSPPESIGVSPHTGLLELKVSGRAVAFPERDQSGRVFFQREVSPAREEDRLDVVVQRRVTDELPLLILTRLEVRVSGKNREVPLSGALLPGFTPLSLTSPLPAKLAPGGGLLAQVRPGTFVLELAARAPAKVDALELPAFPAWPAEETWVFEAKSHLRQVRVDGASQVDPQQTTLPEAWRGLPAYRLRAGEKLALTEERRGDPEPAPDQLQLSRTLWLDFGGTGYSVHDAISGTLNRSWRLEMNAPYVLGHVAVGGRDQLITRTTDAAPPGVEIRRGQLELTADSRLEGSSSRLPAVGWEHDFSAVEATLHLPPGWRLFSASGADHVPGTWLRSWSLLDLFLALITALAVARLFGRPWGVAALCTLVLIFPESDAPRWLWLPVLAAEALLRVLPEGRWRKWVAASKLGLLVLLVAAAVPFLVQQLRVGMYPALEHRYSGMRPSPETARLRTRPAAPAAQVRAEPEEEEEKEAAAAEGAEAQEDETEEDEYQDSSLGFSSLGASAGKLEKAGERKRAYLTENRPDDVIQTGFSRPSWSWNVVTLGFSGPVRRDQQLTLRLIPPWANFLLDVLRVLFTGALLLCLAGVRKLPRLPLRPGPAAPAAALVVLLLCPLARANTPTPELLNELRERLTARPACAPNCASSPRMKLEVSARTLRARLEVTAAAATAVPLPGSAGQWSPSVVLLNGANAPALTRTPSGELWVALGEGTHQLVVEGPLPERDSVQIALPLRPHHVDAQVEGWHLGGLHEGGLSDAHLQLTRKLEPTRPEPGTGSLGSSTFPPFVRVERELSLGLTWEVLTKVVRLSPPGAAIVLEVPLLSGESVTSAGVRAEKGRALVNMAPGAQETSWSSSLPITDALRLVAPQTTSWTEVWRLDASAIWHVTLSGIPIVHHKDSAGARLPEWRPWPGEEVRVAVGRPLGVPGPTLTLDESHLTVTPGVRATDATLSFNARSSRGGEHKVLLPEGAELLGVTVNWTSQPIRQEGRTVSLPVVPGAQRFGLTWREPRGVTALFRTSAVDLGAPSANAHLDAELGNDRWILFAGGPRLGPAVLFWSELAMVVLLALVLGRLPFSPLRSWEWLLLGVGLTQVPVAASAAVALWLIGLGYRKAHPSAAWLEFNLRQLGLLVLTAIAFVIIAVAVHQGLLGRPDMQIAGNGSAGTALRWYTDRAGQVLPAGWVFSVPLFAYRLAMLLWALWLAASLLRWLKWAYAAWTEGGAWQRRPPRVAPAPVSQR